MDNFKNVDSQKDNAPPAAFNQIKDNLNGNNNNAILEESSYNLFSSFPNNMDNSNNINQIQINSFQSTENRIPQNINYPRNDPIYQYYNMMSLYKMNYLNQVNYINNQMHMNRLNYLNQGKNINIESLLFFLTCVLGNKKIYKLPGDFSFLGIHIYL